MALNVYTIAVLPAEILRMDEKSKQLFHEALKKGEEKVYNIRVMVVGHSGVGKTTLIKRLLGKDVNIEERIATEGIDVDIHCCDVPIKTFEWKVHETKTADSKEDALILRVAKVVNEKAKFSDKSKQENHPSKNHPDNEEPDRVILSTDEIQVKIIQEDVKSESIEKIPSTAGGEKQTKPAENTSNISEFIGSSSTDLKGDMLHSLLCQKAHKLPFSTDEQASLAIWDFAGQFAYYTTHQTFMTRRAIYLLVLDVSEKFDNTVYDEYYLDSRGKIQYRVRDLVDVWLNFIHSCASSSEEGIPPVILVGTHVDKIRGCDKHEFCESYFKEVRACLKDKPSRFHLVNEEFAIDNTVVDSKLEHLKKKIVQVASQQKYWGEKIPAQWLLLEQSLMKLKCDGKKVIPRSVLEDLAATHEIATDQLELFLRFHHDIGMILYFSIEKLKEKIVLDQKWMIDALKSLINANDLAVMRNNPRVSNKVLLFKDYGILYPELIDAIWNKEQCPEFHDNKEHILLLMEQLNIIARPRSYAASEIKVENYFLAPCMVHQAAPREIINPEPHSEMGSSSVLCYVFVGKFLPTPIFNKLLAACLTEWPLAKKNSHNLIFCGCSVFEVDPCHDLTLHFKDYVIFVRVTKMSKIDKTPDSDICIKVMDFISTNLSKLIGDQCQSLRFEWYIQCTLSEADCLDSMISVINLHKSKESTCSSHGAKHVVVSHDLLKFWFKDEKQLDDGGGAVQKWPKILKTKKQASSTKSEDILPTQKTSNTTTQPSVQTPSKQTKPKMDVPAAFTSENKGVTRSDPNTLYQVLNKSTQDASCGRSTLKGNCLKLGLKFHGETPANGNCFFEAVSSQLQRLNCSVQKSPQQLRCDVIKFIKNNKVLEVSEGTIDFAEYVASETFEHYCKRMAKDGEWADHMVVVGMARMLQHDILIVTSSPSAGPNNIRVRIVGKPNFNEEPILLGHIWEHHYESLQPIGDNITPEVEVIDQINQHGSEEPQAKIEQHVTEDPHTHINYDINEDPKPHTEQLVSEDPYVQAEQNFIEDSYTKIEQRVQNIDKSEETCLSISNRTVPEQCQKSSQKRALPPQKKYHAFFSYASPDIQWVKETVKKLENNHGFVCCEYDRDNTPGTSLLKFAEDSLRDAYKTVVIMTREAFESDFVLHEIQMAMNQGFIAKRKFVVPVLVEDCDIPMYLKVLNYVDARDTNRSNIWWPKLLKELES